MKRAVVMGASSGIGREVARLLLQQGWCVGVAARRIERLDELCSAFPQLAVAETIDVTSQNAAERLRTLIDRLGGMDIYIHSSGVGWQNVTLDAELEICTVVTNGVGFTRMVDAAFQYFREQNGGHIVAISSIAGTKGLGPAPSYSATKAFQNTYLESLEQLSCNLRLGICITDIRPGFVDTPLIENTNYPLKLNSQDVARQIVKAIVKKRHVCVVDWRYRCLVAIWRMLPRWIWRKLPLCSM